MTKLSSNYHSKKMLIVNILKIKLFLNIYDKIILKLLS